MSNFLENLIKSPKKSDWLIFKGTFKYHTNEFLEQMVELISLAVDLGRDEIINIMLEQVSADVSKEKLNAILQKLIANTSKLSAKNLNTALMLAFKTNSTDSAEEIYAQLTKEKIIAIRSVTTDPTTPSALDYAFQFNNKILTSLALKLQLTNLTKFLQYSAQQIRVTIEIGVTNNQPLQFSHLFSIFDIYYSSKKIADLLILQDDPNGSKFIEAASAFLAWRWAQVAGSFRCYTSMPDDLISKSCFELAKLINLAHPDRSLLTILMPSLEHLKDASLGSYNDAEEYKITHAVMSDDNKSILPIEILINYLHNGWELPSALANPYLQGTNENPEAVKLSKSEFQRLINHSQETRKLYKAFIALRKQKTDGTSPGNELTKLLDGLRAGQAKDLAGEFEAGDEALIAIAKFGEYLNSLPTELQDELLSLKASPNSTSSLKKTWEILNKKDQKSLDCAKERADEIESIIKSAHNKVFLFEDNLEKAEAEFNDAKAAVKACLAGLNEFHVTDHYSLDEIPRLVNFVMDFFDEASKADFIINVRDVLISLSQEKSSLLHLFAAYGNTIQNQRLIEEASKHSLRFRELDSNGNTALHMAAIHQNKEGAILLIDSRQINCPNNAGQTPLLLALYSQNANLHALFLNTRANFINSETISQYILYFAKENNIDIVNKLLMYAKTRLLYIATHQCFSTGNTALQWAISHDNFEMVKLLSDRISFDVGNFQRKTCIDSAIDKGDVEILDHILTTAEKIGFNRMTLVDVFMDNFEKNTSQRGLNAIVELAKKRGLINFWKELFSFWEPLLSDIFEKIPNSLDKIVKIDPLEPQFNFEMNEILKSACKLKKWELAIKIAKSILSPEEKLQGAEICDRLENINILIQLKTVCFRDYKKTENHLKLNDLKTIDETLSACKRLPNIKNYSSILLGCLYEIKARSDEEHRKQIFPWKPESDFSKNIKEMIANFTAVLNTRNQMPDNFTQAAAIAAYKEFKPPHSSPSLSHRQREE